LQLFLTICAAVQHAHQNLVVHRDLKPSNILITPDGAPKLLDFGIAKILNSELSPLSTERTRTELRVLTPNYASPEQVRGEKLMTTASDIYSLGVVLYELLTGHRPYRVTGALPHELARVICEQEPTRPSHVISHVEAVAAGDDTDSRLIVTPEAIARDRDTTPEKLRRQLTGDIDNIVLMALRKEPQRRYHSAAEFAADVRRHLDGLPVIARKDTFKYRATKFVKRHKAGVAAAALVALTICAGIVTSLWLAHRAETQRARAERRFGDLRQLSNALLSDIAPKIERLPGSIDARGALVRQSLKYLDSLAQESGDDAQVQSELASAYEKVGSLQGDPSRPNLSDFSGAVASYEKAQGIRRRLLAQDPNNLTHLRLLAKNHQELVNVRWWMNNLSESVKESESALALYEKLVAEQPGDLELQLAQANANIDLSYTYAHNNQYAKSYPYIGRALASLEKLRHTNPEHRDVLRLLGKGYTQLAISLSWDGQQAAGEAEMAKALAINEALVRREPRDAIFRHGLFATYLQSSSLYEEIDDRLSERYALKALDLTAETIAQDPANTQARQNLAKVYSRLIIISSNLNKLREANAYTEKALASVGELERSEPQNLTYKADLGRVYSRIGNTKFKQGDLRGALEAFEKSNANFEKVSRADSRDTVSLRDIAQNCKEAGRIHRDLARATDDAAQRAQHLDATRQNYERAANLLRQLKEQNALAEYDQKLFAEVQAAISQIYWK
jgi:non-specific serine/threonine protein kinase/serine/threonine-protein kinase